MLLIKKASILGVQARFDEARELLLELNRQHPKDRLILKKLVLVNEQLRDTSKAAAFLKAYRTSGPGRPLGRRQAKPNTRASASPENPTTNLA